MTHQCSFKCLLPWKQAAGIQVWYSDNGLSLSLSCSLCHFRPPSTLLLYPSVWLSQHLPILSVSCLDFHSFTSLPPPAFSRFSFSPTFLPLAHFIHVNLVAMPHISCLSSSIAYLFVASSSSPLSLHPPRPTRASSPLIPSVSISSFWPCFLSFAVSSVCSYTAKLWCSNKQTHRQTRASQIYSL